AVFYMHAYRKNRNKLNPILATKESIPEVSSSIIASGLTTIGSFISLYFMKFGIGADLANVLIKSVVLSIVTVIVLQPILTLLLDKLIMATSHNFTEKINKKIRTKKPNYKGITPESIVKPIAKFSVWQRVALVVVAVALLVPSFIGQHSLNYTYFKMYDVPSNTSEEITATELGNQLILAVPLKTRNNKSHKDFIEAINADPNNKVSGVVSAFTSIEMDTDTMEALLNIITSEDGLSKIQNILQDLADKDSQTYTMMNSYLKKLEENPIDLDEYDFSEYADIDLDNMLSGFDSNMLDSYFAKVGETNKKDGQWYTLYTISIKGSAEDDAAASCYEYLRGLTNEYFGYNNSYSIGMVTGAYDLRQTTPTDFLLVTLISASIILLIISLLLKNPLKGLLLVILIELGIWINLSFSFLFAEQVNFMVYIIISSVQLGCTVDYAILMANTYERNRKKYSNSKECAIESAAETVPTIFTSVLIIVSICMVVFFVSNNLIIKQLTGMLARGASISFILVALVQPALMSFFKKEKEKVDYSKKLEQLEENQNKLK
ncbi:MAG: MMPL family transporter, partial [Clostridia bacterium]